MSAFKHESFMGVERMLFFFFTKVKQKHSKLESVPIRILRKRLHALFSSFFFFKALQQSKGTPQLLCSPETFSSNTRLIVHRTCSIWSRGLRNS